MDTLILQCLKITQINCSDIMTFFNHASVGISNWLQIYSNHDRSITVIEGSQTHKALSASITVLNENYTGKSALFSKSWAGKNCKRITETRPIVLPGMAPQINA